MDDAKKCAISTKVALSHECEVKAERGRSHKVWIKDVEISAPQLFEVATRRNGEEKELARRGRRREGRKVLGMVGEVRRSEAYNAPGARTAPWPLRA
jgi:hypothetical protein